MSEKTQQITVALIGNPNSGKSTLFNTLTGLKQSTGNFPGVTVDKKEGRLSLNGKRINIIDLPGTYSIHPVSMDEKVACEIITNPENEYYPDITIVVADVTNLKRSLFLATQVIDLKIPVILCLNMFDLLESSGVQLNLNKLEQELGVPVIPISAKENKGIKELKTCISGTVHASSKLFLDKSFENSSDEKIERYKKISELINNVVANATQLPVERITKKLDKLFTHPVWGYLIFLFILFLIFQSIFYLSSYPMNWIENVFIKLSVWLETVFHEGELRELLVNGVLSGLSGVLIFVPQIAFLFLFIAVLEDSGYMSRVSFIMDRMLKRFGLNGKSIIPMIGGVACAVPAIMSSRTISSFKERTITILITPLMSCSARLPVYTLLISLVAPGNAYYGIFSVQGLLLMALYMLGFLSALIVALIFKYLIKAKERSYFIMELPVYRWPKWWSVFSTILEKVKIFIWDAGKIIVAIAIILWFLSSHAPGNRYSEIEQKYSAAGNTTYSSEEEKENLIAAEKLEASYAGIIGKAIEPAIKPLGFDWKIGIALVTSFAAREVFVGTMATMYSVGDADNTKSIREKMAAEKKADGSKLYSVAMCFSLMLFYAFAMQCMSTLAIVYRETNSWKYPLIQFVYMSMLAYGSSLLVYKIFG